MPKQQPMTICWPRGRSSDASQRYAQPLPRLPLARRLRRRRTSGRVTKYRATVTAGHVSSPSARFCRRYLPRRRHLILAAPTPTKCWIPRRWRITDATSWADDGASSMRHGYHAEAFTMLTIRRKSLTISLLPRAQARHTLPPTSAGYLPPRRQPWARHGMVLGDWLLL